MNADVNAASTADGYFRSPTIHDDTIVFVCEDDLWSVPVSGGLARRLTSCEGKASDPLLSPDGRDLAFVGRDEGHPEVYGMPARGGPARRLTFLAAGCQVVAWTLDSRAVVYASSAGQPFAKSMVLYEVDRDGGAPRPLPFGPARRVAFAPGGGGGVVIGRNTGDPARWKRYRGGAAGDIWIDPDGAGRFRRLVGLAGNLASPLWVGERIYFLSDHEGTGNLYSCTPAGEDLVRHTDHTDFYARNATSDGRRIVYHAGAEIHVFEPSEDGDPAAGTARRVPIEVASARTQRNRRFVDAGRYLECYDVHPKGHSLALTTRGKVFTLGGFEGPPIQHGEPDGVRYRLAAWLADGRRVVAVSDEAAADEVLIVFDAAEVPDGAGAGRLDRLDIGRPTDLVPAPQPRGDLVAVANQRNEVLVVDLGRKEARPLDRSRFGRIQGLAWSPCGRWLAYAFPTSHKRCEVRLVNLETGARGAATRSVLRDVQPCFDPEGRYLYFLSYREFKPIYDALQFELSFPRASRPYLVTLRRDVPNPFLPPPRAPGDDGKGGADGAKKEEKKEDRKDEKSGAGSGSSSSPGAASGDKKPEEPKPTEIDLEGIERRILALPIPEGRYLGLRALPGKVLYLSQPLEWSDSWKDDDLASKASLKMYDLVERKTETIALDVVSFALSADLKTLVLRSGNRLRALKAGEKPKEESDAPGRKSGWVDLDRVKVSVSPPAEWRQMVREAWRLQRDQFWTPCMCRVDWAAALERYLPLVDRVTTRGELSDLLWEMHGELGTSHAYELGGDYRPAPSYDQGLIATDFVWDEEAGGYRVTGIAAGDPWDEEAGSPLGRAGADVRPGDVLIAVNGHRLTRRRGPAEVLVHQAGNEVRLTFAARPEAAPAAAAPAAGEAAPAPAPAPAAPAAGPRIVTIRALRGEELARYREWVEEKRRRVHEASGGRLGYIHIPDMGPRGYAEFHRAFLAELERDGLVVDVRWNNGGHVSPLLLEKLARRRIGYDVSRWVEPEPYPSESVAGPLVALTNEHAGSDGDIFCHVWKLMKLGPLVGKRTWGGVVGIWPRHRLVDGTVTTQPEFSFWFEDQGFAIENHGTEPEIEVEATPEDHAAGRDPQLERAVAEALRRLDEQPCARPDLSERPDRAAPRLPARAAPEPVTVRAEA